MKLIKSTLPDATKMFRGKTKPQLIIEEFLNSDYDCAECIIENGEYKHANSAYTTFHSAIKRYSYSCQVHTANNKVYLVKPALYKA